MLEKIDVYKLFNKCPLHVKKCLEQSFGTRLNEKIWAGRNLSSGIDYTGAEIDKHRTSLMQHLSSFSPIHNILEVGCGTGLNLYLLSKRYPSAVIKGIDINDNSVQYGNKFFKHNGILNVELIVGKADSLQQFRDKTFDVVFTDATLIYIAPDKIKKVVEEILRVSSRGVVFLEWDYSHNIYVGHWVRPYKELLKKLSPRRNVTVNRLPDGMFDGDKNWKKYGAIIKVCE